MKDISNSVRESIIVHLRNGLSVRQTASKVGVGKTTVSKVRQTIDLDPFASSFGRPRILSIRTKRKMVRLLQSGEADTAEGLRKKLKTEEDITVSSDTIRRALKEQGLKAFVKPKKPKLLNRHKKQRLDFAKKYEYWTIEDWKRIIWSDETKINRFGSDGRKWGWKIPGGPLNSNHVKGTVKHGGGNLKIWGCMTYEGVGYKCRIDGRMDAKLYTKILDSYLYQSAEYYGIKRDDFIFQQDNDPKHTSKMAINWLKNNEIQLLDWPAQSPDLNPIEHLWEHLKRRLDSYEEVPKSMHELWERIEKEWEAIPKEECRKLIYTMPKRIEAVLKAKGGNTKY
jgi:transposase